MPERPTASVVVPFAGPQADFEAAIGRLRRLRLRGGDEVIVVDNRRRPQPALDPGAVRVIVANEVRTPAYARNMGARESSGAWLVFLDADTHPVQDLLDEYFAPAPAERTGVLWGGIRDAYTHDTLVARYVSARGMMEQRTTLRHRYAPFVQTANCAVRRAAFDSVGGLTESIRTCEDADLCWRLASAQWELEGRPAASVSHRNRETLRALLAQQAQYGAGAAWLERRYPGAAPSRTVRELVGLTRYYVRRAARGGPRAGEPARFALLDLLIVYMDVVGRLRSNERGL